MNLQEAEELLSDLQDERLMLEVERRFANAEDLPTIDDKLGSLNSRLTDLVTYIDSLQ